MPAAPPPRPYGYRTRDDSRPELGIGPDPYHQGTPGDVADAIARAGGTLSGVTPTASITKSGSGLLFRDRFDRANGGLGADWTTVAGTWAIAGNLAHGAPAAATVDDVVASVLAARGEQVVQGVLRASAGGKVGLRARWDGAIDTAGSDYLLWLEPGIGVTLYKHLAGAYTALGANANAALAAGVLYGCKLHVKNSYQRAYIDGQLAAVATDAALDAATGKAGIRSYNAGVDVDDFAVYSSNVVAVTNLPAGYQARINGTVYASVAGTASCDLAAAMCPLQAIEVLDGFNNVVATLVPGDGIWGGDSYVFSPVGAPGLVTVTPLAATGLRIEWPAIADAEAYRVEWHNGDGAWAALPDLPAARRTIDHTGLTERSTRYYRVSALAGGSLGAPSATASGTTLCAAPTDFHTTSLAAGGVTLAWTDASAKEANYQLQRAPASGAYADIGAPLAANSTTATDATAVDGTSYRYRVAVIGPDGARNYSNEAAAQVADLGVITRTTDGLLFKDDFNRADEQAVGAGKNWSRMGGPSVDADWQLQSNRINALSVGAGSSQAEMYPTGLAGYTGDVVVQAWWQRGNGSGRSGLELVMAAEAGGINVVRDPFNGWELWNFGSGFYNRVATQGAFTRESGVMKLRRKAGLFQAWIDGNLLFNGAVDARTDAMALIPSFVQMQQPASYDDFVGCKGNTVAITSLPNGYKLRVSGVVSSAAAGGAAVSVDVGATSFPIAQLEVLDPSGNVVKVHAPAAGIYGGDVYLLGAPPVIPTQTCTVGIGPGGNFGGVNVAIAPYYQALMFTGETVINSHPNINGRPDNGSQSLPTEITFDAPVRSVTVKCWDTNFAGNVMIAYDVANVELGRIEFLYPVRNTGTPRTLTYDGIRKIRLEPAVGEFVGYLGIVFST